MATITDQRIVLALKEQRINKLLQIDIMHRLSILLPNIYSIAGYRCPESHDLTSLFGLFSQKLMRSFGQLTMAEVEYCLEQGAFGDWGDYTGLSPRLFTRWLKQYMQTDRRHQAYLEHQKEAGQKALTTESDSERTIRRGEYLQYSYSRFLNNYPLDQMLTWRIYDQLEELNLIRYTETEKLETANRLQNWKPGTQRPLNAEDLAHWRQSEVKTCLLRRYFEGLRERGITELPL